MPGRTPALRRTIELYVPLAYSSCHTAGRGAGIMPYRTTLHYLKHNPGDADHESIKGHVWRPGPALYPDADDHGRSSSRLLYL